MERLQSHRTLGSVPREQLEWVAAHGQERHLNPCDVLTPSSGPVEGLYVVLDGHLSIRVDRGAGPKKVMEWHGGDVTGMLPFSRVKSPPGSVVAEEPTDVFMVPNANLPALIRDCPELTAVLVHVMLDRARVFKSSELLDEKMLSLGRLAAGLAHELNNPASAVARSALLLLAEMKELDDTAKAFCSLNLNDTQCAVVSRLREAGADEAMTWTPIELADREDAMSEWLDEHQVTAVDPRTFAESAITIADLEALQTTVGEASLMKVLPYIATGRSVRRLVSEIGVAAARIHTLVAAVKGFTYMDQHAVAKPVAIAKGLSDTLTLLGAKARSKSVQLKLDVAPALPDVDGFGGELNQVWANLVDNAIDAAPGGRVTVSAGADDSSIVVRVKDTGPGIPPDVAARMFDPFFTTKAVGEGTGLGLDIARRIIARHHGEIDMTTGASGTEFRVTLPLSRPAP